MIRVVHIIASLDSGGAERMMTRIVCYKSRNSHKLWHVVICLKDKGTYGSLIQQQGIRVHCLDMEPNVGSLFKIFKLISLLKVTKPDVLMTWLHHADLIGSISAILSGISLKRVVWNIRCSHIKPLKAGWYNKLSLKLLSKLSPYVGTVAFNSYAGKEDHEKEGYNPQEWRYLPNGIETDEWYPDALDRLAVREEIGIERDKLLIGMVARNHPQKDHETFIKACEQLIEKNSNIHFLLIGADMTKLSLPRNLYDHIKLQDFSPNIPKVMRSLDIKVLSSAYGEGFPNVLIEAMATGVPCVATNVGDNAIIIKDTGQVVPPRDPNALTNAIEEILAEAPETRKVRGNKARQRVIENYSFENAFQNYLDLFKSIYKKNSICLDHQQD